MAKTFRIVTVHGTNEREISQVGAKWWQRRSSFQKKVCSLLDPDARIEWVPHSWSGRNSERERRVEARRLQKTLERFAGEEGSVTAVIGHSHGGGMVRRALFQSRAQDFGSAYGILVGAPFFGPGSVWSARVQVVFVPLIFALVAMASVVLIGRQLQGRVVVSEPVAGLLSGYAALIVGALVVEVVVNRWWNSPAFHALVAGVPKASEKAPSKFERRSESLNLRCPCLFSSSDEAINGLIALADHSVNVATPATTRLPTAFFLAGVFSVAMSWLEVTFSLPNTEFQYGGHAFAICWNAIAGFLHPFWSIFFVGLLAGVLFSYLGVAWLVSYIINSLVKYNLLAQAFGRDFAAIWGTMDKAFRYPPALSEGQRWRPLPQAFDRVVAKFVDAQAPETLRAAREALGVAAVSQTRSLLDALLSNLSWRELVHTSYFEVQDLAEFVGWLLVEKAGFPPSQQYRDLDTAKYAGWYAEIAPSDVARGLSAG